MTPASEEESALDAGCVSISSAGFRCLFFPPLFSGANICARTREPVLQHRATKEEDGDPHDDGRRERLRRLANEMPVLCGCEGLM